MRLSTLPTYVISLTRAVERRVQFAAECAQAGITYQIFDGVDGRAREAELLAKSDPVAWRRFMGSEISAGHMGCYASHVDLWAQIGHGPDPVALICEDDVVFHADFAQAVEAALALQDRWDICRFAKIRAKGAIAQATRDGYTLNAYWGPFTGNACYLIKRETAAKLAASFYPIRRAHDHELNRIFAYNIRLTGLTPWPAHPEDQGESFLTGSAMARNHKLPKWKRLPHYAHKLANYPRRLLWLARNGMLSHRR